jgi:uncharacterized protein (DUF427 family)
MKQPGPDHPLAIAPNPRRVRVRLRGRVVAETANALTLSEARYAPVQYIPRDDADMAAFIPTERRTCCPYKGEARYFTLSANGYTAENAAWSYEHPYPAVKEIAGYLAFYPDRVDAIEEL